MNASVRSAARCGAGSARAEQFALFEPAQREAIWISTYNAWTVALILDRPEAESIRELGGWFSSVFDRRFVPLQHLGGGKQSLSLGAIEHEILRRTARPPLFHFAIVCASSIATTIGA